MGAISAADNPGPKAPITPPTATPPSTGTAAAAGAGSAATPGAVPTPMPPPAGPAANSGAAGRGAIGAAAGAAAPAAGGEGTATSTAGSPAATPTPTGPSCQPQIFLPRDPGATSDNVLFLLDRSSDMALDFQGQPRWQLSGHALVEALKELNSIPLQVGALFYPSPNVCVVPGIGCTITGSTSACTVSAMSSSDQIRFQPLAQAIDALSAQPELYQPIMTMGVPLRESLERADAAMSGANMPQGRTRVVLLANSQPSCRWNQDQTAALVSGWRTRRNVTTRVIALPGANPTDMDRLSALAQAAGQPRVVAPTDAAALRSAVESSVLGSLDSCTLQLDPPVPAGADVHVVVGVQGVERELPRTSAAGEALWTISADGTQLTLLGSACQKAGAGDYDSLRVEVGCSRQLPLAQ